MSYIVQKASKDINDIPCKKDISPIKIALIGEIYIASEPFANLEIERKLNYMGAEVHNYLGPSMWVKEHLINKLIPFSRNKSLTLAKEFFNTNDIGGHGINTVGNAIISAKQGFDGVIQLYPLTCTPEIIASSCFEFIQNKYDIPIMKLVLDEMTGEAGYLTRLEAFVDMLKMKNSKVI